MNENEDKFNFSYCAKQQEEIRKIRDKYISKEENKMEQLRRLDASVSKPGTIVSIILGVIGTLLLGGGMSCTMVWKEELFIPGIILGAIGIVCIIAAYPIYLHITGKRKKKLAPEIIRLTDELTKGQ